MENWVWQHFYTSQIDTSFTTCPLLLLFSRFTNMGVPSLQEDISTQLWLILINYDGFVSLFPSTRMISSIKTRIVQGRKDQGSQSLYQHLFYKSFWESLSIGDADPCIFTCVQEPLFTIASVVQGVMGVVGWGGRRSDVPRRASTNLDPPTRKHCPGVE